VVVEWKFKATKTQKALSKRIGPDKGGHWEIDKGRNIKGALTPLTEKVTHSHKHNVSKSKGDDSLKNYRN